MMRLGFHLEEAYLLILSVLILLAAVATGYGQWASSRATTTQQQQRIRLVNSRVRSAWWLIGILPSRSGWDRERFWLFSPFSRFLS